MQLRIVNYLDTPMGMKSDILQRQFDATDRQIDQLVYQLYGLTDDEIKIVEGQG
jgi:hypothetical protein